MHTMVWTRAALLTGVVILALNGVAVGPRAAHGAGSPTVVPSVRVSHDGFGAHAEPSVAADPRDPRVLLGAAMLIQGHHVAVGTFRSGNGGRTWQDHGPLAMPGGTTYSGDVTVAFDAHGTGFIACVVQSARGDGVYVWRSDDEGRSFDRPVAVMRGPFADHPGLAVDPAPGTANGTVYVAWRTRSGLAFGRSVDGGRHFSASRLIVPGQEIYVPAIAAGPRGMVGVAYEVIASDLSAHVEVVSSLDYGRHFGRPAVLGAMTDTLTPAPGVRVPTGPSIAADPRGGSAYVTYVDDRAGRVSIFLARSRDGGRTWSVALRIPAMLGAAASVPFQPHVAIDNTGGVVVAYLVLAQGRVSVVLARSAMHGAAAWSFHQVTNRPFDPTLGVISAGKGDQGPSWWIGDYQGLTVGGGLIYPMWSDTRTGRLEIFTATVPTGTL